MTSEPSPNNQNGTANFANNVLASLIATALFLAGSWLAGRQVPEDIALQYSFSEQRAGHLASWNIQLINATDVAFNVKVSTPKVNILAREFSPPSQATSGWTGQLMKGQKVEALLVLEDPTARLSSVVVQDMITATYDERNSTTGVIEPRAAEVKEIGVIGVVRIALFVFWFMLPITTAGLPLLLFKGWKWWSARRTVAPPVNASQKAP